jgi:hypothetical protein
MIVRQDTDGSLLADVSAAPRALVFLTVPWSGPERTARLAFRAAAEQLAAEYAGLAIRFFSLDEDAEWCQRWLAGLAIPQLGGGHPLGAGSMVWLENGRPVASEIGGAALQARGVVARSLWLWGTAEPAAAADRGRMTPF